MKKFFVFFAVFVAMVFMINGQSKSQVKKKAKIKLEWSTVSDDTMTWNQAVRYCKNLVEDGHDDWRLPSVDEFRTTIPPEYFPWYAVGGLCPLSDQNNCLSLSCYQKDVEICGLTSSQFSTPYLAFKLASSYLKEPFGTEFWKIGTEKIQEYWKKHPEIEKKMEKTLKAEIFKVNSLLESNPPFWTSSPISDDATLHWASFLQGFMFASSLDEDNVKVKCVRGNLPNEVIITKSNGLGSDFINWSRYNEGEKSKKAGDSGNKTTPKKDLQNQMTWSSKSKKAMNWYDAIDYCKNLNEDGHNDWRLPNIDELRTLIKNCPKTETGGECKVSEKNGCLSDSCRNPRGSSYCEDRSNNGGYYSKLGDNDNVALWSSSVVSDDSYYRWYVGFRYGGVNLHGVDGNGYVRCVRASQNEANSQNPSATSFQTETTTKNSAEPTKIEDLAWSSKSKKEMNYYDAVDYCKNLNEDGHKDWRLPNIDELRTLIKNCPKTETDGQCKVSERNGCLSSSCWKPRGSCYCEDEGNYNKLGDIGGFWSSSVLSNGSDYVWIVDFSYGHVVNPNKSGSAASVRCVRASQNEANSQNPNATSSQTETTTKNSAEPTKIEDLAWSSKSKKEMNYYDAVDYCKNLNEDGHNDWRLPNIDELRTLIKNCPKTETGGECKVSEKGGCPQNACWQPRGSCYCEDGGDYSKFGDNDILWSSSLIPEVFTLLNPNTDIAWSVNFRLGLVDGCNKSRDHYVRCVR